MMTLDPCPPHLSGPRQHADVALDKLTYSVLGLESLGAQSFVVQIGKLRLQLPGGGQRPAWDLGAASAEVSSSQGSRFVCFPSLPDARSPSLQAVDAVVRSQVPSLLKPAQELRNQVAAMTASASGNGSSFPSSLGPFKDVSSFINGRGGY